MSGRLIDRALLDAATAAARASPRRRKNRNFHASEADTSHRLLNAVEPGTYIPPHRHNDPAKDESIIVLRGRLGAVFFDETGRVTEHALLQPGGAVVGINVPHGSYHSVIALAPGTVFFEAKAGPYEPLRPEEKAPWAPAESDPDVGDYLEELSALFVPRAT